VTKREQFSSEFFPMKVRKRETDLLFLSELLSDAITQLPMDKTNYQRKEIAKKRNSE
jgi:hypothetical protein